MQTSVSGVAVSVYPPTFRVQHPKVRTDLSYHADPNEDGRFFIKDPIRHQFFRYNELQVEMMRALDGKRSPDQVAEYLKKQFDADVPTQAIQRFVTRLQGNLLLDVSSYAVDDELTRKRILGYLDKKGLALRVKARDGTTREGQVFEAATKELLDGDPCNAARHLHDVLDINPKNERARKILLAIHLSYFKAQGNTVSHAKMFHAFNPDRLLAWFDRLVGRFVFSKLGLIALLLLMLSAIPSFLMVMSQPATFDNVTTFDLVFAIIAGQLIGFHHELCHGLATKHYGGTVDDMGWMLFYGVVPAYYCDTSDSYLFPKVQQKIIVQVAGPLGTLSLLALIFHFLAMTDTSFPLWTGTAWLALLGLYNCYNNAVPFVKQDAYYALNDYLGVSNLMDSSLGRVRDVLQKFIFGVEPEGAEMANRERRIYTIFGFLAVAYFIFFLWSIYLNWLLPWLIDVLGILGVAFSVYFFAKLLFRALVPRIPRLARFVYKNRKVIFTPKRSLAFATSFGLVVAASAAPWPLYVDGTLIVEPIERAEIRIGEPGLLAEVMVKRGDHIEAGQVVAVLRNDALRRDRAMAEAELVIASTTLGKLRKGVRTEEVRLAAARARADQVRSSAAVGRVADARKNARLGVDTTQNMLTARGEATHAIGAAAVSNAQAALDTAGTREEELSAAEANVRMLESRIADLDTRIAQLDVKSTLSGTVVTMDLARRLDTALQKGDLLLEVHATSQWRARIIPDRGEPLDGLAPGLRIVMAANGDPHHSVEARIENILPPPDKETGMIIYSVPVTHKNWRSGMHGQARIYAPKRSVVHRLLVVPIVRIVDFALPAL